MPRKTPLITVSAVVTPVIAEEIAALAKANKVTKSQMVRQLLEERLVQRANQRTEDAYDRLEKRLKRIEDRFAGLIIACTKLAAQAVYIGITILRYGKSNTKEQLDKHWDNSIKYAAEQVSKKVKAEEKPEKAED
jgi:predicted nucleic acid-binding protein